MLRWISILPHLRNLHLESTRGHLLHYSSRRRVRIIPVHAGLRSYFRHFLSNLVYLLLILNRECRLGRSKLTELAGNHLVELLAQDFLISFLVNSRILNVGCEIL